MIEVSFAAEDHRVCARSSEYEAFLACMAANLPSRSGLDLDVTRAHEPPYQRIHGASADEYVRIVNAAKELSRAWNAIWYQGECDTDLTILDILRAARVLLTKPEHWNPAGAHDAKGRRVGCNDPKAVCWDVRGALVRCGDCAFAVREFKRDAWCDNRWLVHSEVLAEFDRLTSDTGVIARSSVLSIRR